MDELLQSFQNLKQQLLCTFCNNLVHSSYKFVACSHIFCREHLQSTQMKKCFVCHKGDVSNVMEDCDVNQMVHDYKQLVALFSSNKENVDDNPKSSGHVADSSKAKQDILVQNKPTLENKNVSKCENIKKTLRNNVKKNIKENVETNVKNAPKTVETNVKNVSKNVEVNVKNIPKTATQNVEANVKNVSKTVKESVETDFKNVPKKATTVPSFIAKTTNIKNPVLKSNVKTEVEKKGTPTSSKPTNGGDVGKKRIQAERSIKLEVGKRNLSLSNESMLDMSGSNYGRNLVKRNKKGETSLHMACVQNKMEDVKVLLEEGASPNSKDNAGWTPLHEAVAAGNEVLVGLLLNHGALPQVPGPHYETPLHEAVRLGYVNIIKLLMEAGASMNAKNDKGETPFSIASEDIKKHLHAVKKHSLSQHHDVSFSTQNLSSFTILPILTKKENITKLQKLVKKHENLKSATEFSKNVTHVLVESENGSSVVIQETLLAVVSGKPIISSDWLAASNDASLADVVKFYLTNLGGDTECVHISLMNKLNLNPSLFSGCHFYFIGFNSKYEISARLNVKRQFLCQLVTEGGGIVLRREPNPESIPENEQVVPYHATPGSPLEFCAHYIIYQNRPTLAYNMKHLKSLPVAWLIECVQNFKLVDP